jgi:hypothetical protein
VRKIEIDTSFSLENILERSHFLRQDESMTLELVLRITVGEDFNLIGLTHPGNGDEYYG